MSLFILKPLLPALMLASMAAPQDAVKLSRIFKADETNTVALALDVDMQGQQIKASVNITFKTAKLLDGGKAKVTLTPKDVKINVGGNDMDAPLDVLETTMDANNLPDTLPTNEAEWLFTISSLSQMLPAQSLKPGDPFELSWASADKASKIKGKGKFAAIEEIDGAKTAKIEYDLGIEPSGAPMAVKMKSTSWFDLTTLQLVKSEGKISSDDGLEMKFTCRKPK